MGNKFSKRRNRHEKYQSYNDNIKPINSCDFSSNIIDLINQPNEILIIIFSFFTVKDMQKYYFSLYPFKSILDHIMKIYGYNQLAIHQKLTIPGSYIIVRKRNGVKKEQIAYIDAFYVSYDNKIPNFTYEFNYGILGYHEGFCTQENIRHLTKEEKKLLKEHKVFSLPQQFYHSVPDFD